MHRAITKAPSGKTVDHVNGNKQDNRRVNLRVCKLGLNCANRTVQTNNKSGYKGVNWLTKNRKWRAEIMVDKKHIHLGLYEDKEEAALAYDIAALNYFGPFARCNILRAFA